jgi:hypothetical protein
LRVAASRGIAAQVKKSRSRRSGRASSRFIGRQRCLPRVPVHGVSHERVVRSSISPGSNLGLGRVPSNSGRDRKPLPAGHDTPHELTSDQATNPPAEQRRASSESCRQ